MTPPDTSLSVPSGTYEDGEIQGVENCIYIVRQSLDTVRAEAGNLPSGEIGVAVREHVIRLLESYRAQLTADRV